MQYLKSFIYTKFIFVIFGLIYFSSCTFDNEEDLLEDFVCDTTDIVYNDLTYIFNGICEQCHGPNLSYKNIRMDTYENAVSSINTGKVWPAINHEPGSPPMPNGLPKLPDCDINKIEAWINAGMPEN